MTSRSHEDGSVQGPGDADEQRPDRHAPHDLADVPEIGEAVEEQRGSPRAWIGRVVGPVLAVLAYLTLPTGPGELSPEGVATVAVGILMAVWWVSEALPLPATALLPIVLFPVLGAADVGDATAPYASDVIFLFMGGFMLALGMQRWGLHRRIALQTIRAVGTKPTRIIGGFMLATAFLSMWVSNTATTVMMLPIGVSVLTLVLTRPEARAELGVDADAEPDEMTGEGASNLATGLMLAIAYAASIGSLATLIGTPPNLFMAGFLEETYGISIGFGRWMMLGLPLAAVFLAIAWFLLTRWLYPPEIDEIEGGRELIRGELHRLGPISRGEKVVLAVFVGTALSWVLREPITGAQWLLDRIPTLAGLTDAGIAVTAALLLFALPVDWRHGVFALDWKTARQLPWGVLLLFGGGLSLAAAVVANGVDEWIGAQVADLGWMPVLALLAVIVVAVILLTELTSNTATAATFLPILGGIAVGLGLDPLLLVIPAALAATCAFMMPVATPPNAIVFGSGHVTIVQMVRAGVWLNLIAAALIVAVMYGLASWTLGVTVG
jgi:solute carrier family 13 (sodium-dependent dicarboxylate transporter), member 2/3/5